jgi:hypothetical protein
VLSNTTHKIQSEQTRIDRIYMCVCVPCLLLSWSINILHNYVAREKIT